MTDDSEARKRYLELSEEWDQIADDIEDFQQEGFRRQREIEAEMESMPYQLDEFGNVVDK